MDNGHEFELDDKGFMKEPERWTEEIAGKLAVLQNIMQLTDDHWKVINYIRQYYLEYGIAPPVKMVSKKTGYESRLILELFPTGAAQGACKIAGLSEPTGCV
jgi:dissimilatory sulfite reductase related protein